jgi:hypothetical protein
MVAHNVEEPPRGSRCAAPKSMDEGRPGHAIIERRDGVVVRRTGKFGAVIGEASDVLTQSLPRLLLAVAQLPLLVEASVCALEVADEDTT